MAVRSWLSRFWLWTLPLLVGGAAAVLFGVGFALALRGSLGEPLGEPPPPPRQAVVPRAAGKGAVRILVLGDSLAKGTGDETGKGFAVRVQESFRANGKVPAELTNLAVNGMETPEVLAVAETANVRALARSASLILLSTGGNDLSHGATFGTRGNEPAANLPDAVAAARGRYVEGLRRILEILREENATAPILLLGLYDPFGATGPFNSTQEGDARSGAARLGASVVLQWNALAQETALAFPGVTVVPTFDLFQGRPDRLSADRYHPNGDAYAAIAARMLQLVGKG
ncbi:MAG TPA: GDSL-type esterase/lipase family protein [Thermoanaerobaculia bacterium]|jgi:lysophospholipase L1-like esterase